MNEMSGKRCANSLKAKSVMVIVCALAFLSERSRLRSRLSRSSGLSSSPRARTETTQASCGEAD